MDKEQAINILIRRTFPFMHDDDAREFDRAVTYLRSLPEPSAPVDEEYEQAFSAWKGETYVYDEEFEQVYSAWRNEIDGYAVLSENGISFWRNGVEETIIACDNKCPKEGFKRMLSIDGFGGVWTREE